MQEASMRWCMHFKVRTPCSHVRRAWEGLWQQSKPNIAFGREGGVKSNPTVALTLGRLCTWGCYPTQRCRCLLGEGGVRSKSTVFSWGINPTGQLTWRSEGWEWCPTQRSRSLCNWGVDLEGCPIATQQGRWVGEKGFINPTQKNKFFGLLSKLNICL